MAKNDTGAKKNVKDPQIKDPNWRQQVRTDCIIARMSGGRSKRTVLKSW